MKTKSNPPTVSYPFGYRYRLIIIYVDLVFPVLFIRNNPPDPHVVLKLAPVAVTTAFMFEIIDTLCIVRSSSDVDCVLSLTASYFTLGNRIVGLTPQFITAHPIQLQHIQSLTNRAYSTIRPFFLFVAPSVSSQSMSQLYWLIFRL